MKPKLILRHAFLLALLLLFTVAQIARATDGAVDLSFDPGSGIDGRVTVIATQPDGKIIIGGDFTTVKGVTTHGVARLNPDGSGDSTFAVDAATVLPTIGAIALQPDGKVLVGYEYGVARLNSDGSIDPTFSAYLYTDLSFYNNFVSALAVQPDGKILVGGYLVTVSTDWNYGIARLNSDGSIDPGFNPGFSLQNEVTLVSSIVVQPDSRVLVGGNFVSYPDGNPHYGVARLNTNGTLDATFAADTSPFSSVGVYDVARQADGKVLIAGEFLAANDSTRTVMARLHPNGTLDAGFYQAPAAVQSSYAPSAWNIAVQTDGRILLGGRFDTLAGATHNHVARLEANGTVDTSFKILTNAQVRVPNTFSLQPDGTVIVATDDVGADRLRRYRADGAPDFTFHCGGVGLADAVSKIELQPDGKILVNRLRLNSDGSRDDTYISAPPPTIQYDLAVAGTLYSYEQARAVQPDGKVLIGGYTYTEEYDGDGYIYQLYSYFLYRFMADGTRDPAFQPQIGPSEYWGSQSIRALAVLPDGKILAGGFFSQMGGLSRSGLARLNANGTVDTNYVPDLSLAVFKLVPLPNGKLLVGNSIGIYRLLNNGLRDVTFNSGSGANGSVNAIQDIGDGRLLIGGTFTSFNAVDRQRIARISEDGALDPSFDPGTGADNTVFAIAVQADGKILIGGAFNSVDGIMRPKLARLLAATNTRPQVAITSPSPGSAFAAPQDVSITATASDEGAVVRVDFRSNGVLIGSSASAPYAFTWQNAPTGNHQLTAVATDDLGSSTTSAAVAITVTNAAPTVNLSTPASNATFAAPATITLRANAADSDGTIARVDFFGGGTFIGSDSTAPYDATWSQVRGGNYALTAVATDNRGASTTSASVNVVVTNVAPTVNITSPAAGSSFVAPAAMTINAAASDSDGVLTRVDFYAGSTLIGTALSAPYTVSWNNVAAGNYTLTARATDDAGAITTAAPVSVTVVLPALPAAPSNLTGRALSRTVDALSWTDRSSNEVGFKIERSSNGKTFSEIGRVSANVTSFTISGLSPGAKQYYRVRAYNTGGDSAYSNTVMVK